MERERSGLSVDVVQFDVGERAFGTREAENRSQRLSYEVRGSAWRERKGNEWDRGVI